MSEMSEIETEVRKIELMAFLLSLEKEVDKNEKLIEKLEISFNNNEIKLKLINEKRSTLEKQIADLTNSIYCVSDRVMQIFVAINKNSKNGT
jgi:septal ring factor EnvC (AmiA/AmiB activator)